MTTLLALALLAPLPGALPGFATLDLDDPDQSFVVHYPDNQCPQTLVNYPLPIAAGDLDGDGRADLAINDLHLPRSASAQSPGEVYVVFGGFPRGQQHDLQKSPADAVILGRASGELFLSAIVIADLTGDDRNDLLLVAPSSSPLEGARFAAGEALLVPGPLRPGQRLDLAREPAPLAICGDGVMHVFRSAAAGDLTGDGVNDLVLAGQGRVLLLRGPLVPGGAIDLLEQAFDWTAYTSRAEGFGSSLAIADLDGDGLDDLVVAAPGASGAGGARSRAGRAYVFFGPLLGPRDVNLDLAPAGATIYGAGNDDRMDRPARGDWNADGQADLAVTALLDGPAGDRIDAGAALLLFGPIARGAEIDLASRGADVVIHGAGSGDQLRQALGADVTGDSRDDLLLGAPFAGARSGRPKAGEVYFLRGPFARGAVLDIARHEAQLVIQGARGEDQPAEHLGDWLGYALAAADFDGLGRVELLAGAAMAARPDDPQRTATGAAYVFDNWTLLGGNFAPTADAGGPYEAPCNGGILGIWLSGEVSFDADRHYPLEFHWATSCPGWIVDPARAVTAVLFECPPCFELRCSVTLTVTDRLGAASRDLEIVRSQPTGASCLELGNVLLASKRDGRTRLRWELVPGAARYDIAQDLEKGFSEPRLAATVSGAELDDIDERLPPGASLVFLRVAGR